MQRLTLRSATVDALEILKFEKNVKSPFYGLVSPAEDEVQKSTPTPYMLVVATANRRMLTVRMMVSCVHMRGESDPSFLDDE